VFRMIEDELLPLCRAHGIGVISYNPLAGGVLTGRYRQTKAVEPGTRFSLKNSGEFYQRRYWNEAVFEEVNRLGDFLEQRGKELTHAALAWVLAQSDITSAILGASKPGQLEESLRGVDEKLDEDELRACDAVWFNLPRERDPQFARR
jgi:1-deoxyxylulose-5-phosphate synthase